MISVDKVRRLALEYEEATESPHFNKTSFRVRNKIFATLNKEKKDVVIKLSLEDQSVFCQGREGIIYPVSGGWGRQGWTVVELAKCDKELFKAALTASYCMVAPKKLATYYLEQ